MDPASAAAVGAWVTEAGLQGASEPDLLRGFCERLSAAGLPLTRAIVVIDTLHPVYEGRAFRWRRDPSRRARRSSSTAGPARTSELAEGWRRSPFYHLLETGAVAAAPQPRPRRSGRLPAAARTLAAQRADRLSGAGPSLRRGRRHRRDGLRLLVLDHRRAGRLRGRARSTRCAGSSRAWRWRSNAPRWPGSPRRWSRPISAATPAGACWRAASPAASPTGSAPCCGSPTCAATPASPTRARPSRSSRSSTTTPRRSSRPIHEAGGDVLKLIGDGTLAIFKADDPQAACRCALAGRGAGSRQRIAALNARRAAEGLPVTERLSRPACRRGVLRQYRQHGPARLHRGRPGGERGQPHRRHVPLGRAGRAALVGLRRRRREPRRAPGFVSVGRYALRGVGRPQELFTLEPGPPSQG